MKRIEKILKNIAFLLVFILLSYFFGTVGCTIMAFDPFFNWLFIVGNWPSIILGIYPMLAGSSGAVGYDAARAIFNPLVVLANSIPWIIVGFAILYFVERKRRKKKQN